jgi:hypothetical protein
LTRTSVKSARTGRQLKVGITFILLSLLFEQESAGDERGPEGRDDEVEPGRFDTLAPEPEPQVSADDEIRSVPASMVSKKKSLRRCQAARSLDGHEPKSRVLRVILTNEATSDQNALSREGR